MAFKQFGVGISWRQGGGAPLGGGSSLGTPILRIVAAVTGFVYDHGPNAYDPATITGTVQQGIPGLLPTLGKDDGALVADATDSNGLVTYPDASGITGTGDLTVAGLAVLTATDRMFLFDQNSGGGSPTRLRLDISGAQGGRIIAYAGAAVTVLITEDDQGIGDGRTHLYVLRRTSGFVEVFIDGRLVGSADGSAEIALGAATSVETDLAVNGGGIVDELAWWTRALTDTEIEALVAASGVLSSSTGLYSGEWIETHLADFAFSDGQIDTGSSMIDTPNLSTGDAAAVLAQVAASEDGMCFVNAAGELVFKGRNEFGFSVATIGDDAGEIPLAETPDWSMDIDRVANRIQVSKDGYALVVADDLESQNNYGIRPLQWSANLLSGSEMESAANWLLSRYKDPLLRIDSATIDGKRDNGAYWPDILALELGDRITVNHHPPGGTLLTAEVIIEHISHTITPDNWVTTLQLSPMPTVWILGDPVYGVLGSTTVLGW